MRQVFIGRNPKLTDDTGVRAQALRHPQARRERDPLLRQGRGRRILLRLQPVLQDARLQGHAACRSRSTQYYPDLAHPAMETRAGAGAFALQHEHLSELGSRAIRTATSRTTAKSTRCAATSTGCTPAQAMFESRPVRRRHQEDPADHQHRRQRLGHVRQLPRTARAGRPLAAARDDDDDSRAVGEPREHERREEGVLRISLLPDGTVGRPGLDRVHRRQADRRGARPQRPAPLALLRDQGRPGHHGLRSRRARHCRRSACCRRAACSRAACSWSTPRKAASSPTRK